ncbi:MAG: hypothetical protein CM15mP77_1780 [Synechococcus sp.]|nr:MAG: hypothetical protein CM15mP77_1780 [Synechococcus sp.]
MAAAVDADQLILLTDVDRLYSADPRLVADARPISDVHHPRELDALEAVAGDGAMGPWWDDHQAGGARIATASGITVHLADGRDPSRLDACCRGAGGTDFIPTRNRWATGAAGWPMPCSPRGLRWMPGPVTRCISGVPPC